ncbi:MAG: cohesin domain-containing protein [Anaerolineae bacterium]
MTHTHKHTQIALIVSFILIVVFAQVFAVGAQSTDPRLSIVPEVAEATEGQTFSVNINISGATSVYGSSFKLSYDPQLFELVQTDNKAVTPGAFFADEPGFTLRNVVDATAGTVEYALTLMQPAQPVDGDGVLGTITLRALQDAPVSVNAISASLVSPEFAEVDGHMVAQKVNQVAVQIDGRVAPQAANEVVEASVQPAVAAVVPASDPAAAQMFTNPELSNTASVQSNQPASVIPAETVQRTDHIVSTLAVAFLAIGVVLLTLSIGLYSRMRVQYTLASHKR